MIIEVACLMINFNYSCFFIVSTTIAIMMAAISITRTTHPTTMPTIQPSEHPTLEPDCAGSMFTVVSGLLWGLESVSISVVVSGSVAVISDVDTITVVTGSKNEN